MTISDWLLFVAYAICSVLNIKLHHDIIKHYINYVQHSKQIEFYLVIIEREEIDIGNQFDDFFQFIIL